MRYDLFKMRIMLNQVRYDINQEWFVLSFGVCDACALFQKLITMVQPSLKAVARPGIAPIVG